MRALRSLVALARVSVGSVTEFVKIILRDQNTPSNVKLVLALVGIAAVVTLFSLILMLFVSDEQWRFGVLPLLVPLLMALFAFGWVSLREPKKTESLAGKPISFHLTNEESAVDVKDARVEFYVNGKKIAVRKTNAKGYVDFNFPANISGNAKTHLIISKEGLQQTKYIGYLPTPSSSRQTLLISPATDSKKPHIRTAPSDPRRVVSCLLPLLIFIGLGAGALFISFPDASNWVSSVLTEIISESETNEHPIEDDEDGISLIGVIVAMLIVSAVVIGGFYIATKGTNNSRHNRPPKRNVKRRNVHRR